MQARQSLTEGPIPQTLLTFALPIWLGHVLQSVNGSVNVTGVSFNFLISGVLIALLYPGLLSLRRMAQQPYDSG